MTNTENYNLNLIEEHDLLDYAPFNENAQIIDAEMKRLSDTVTPIPTLETAVGNNSAAITAVENDLAGTKSRVSANESDIADIKTVNTSQTGRIEALEAKEATVILNGSEIAVADRYNFIFTDVDVKQNSYYGYYYSDVDIPLSAIGNPSNYKVLSAVAYNSGLTFANTVTGAVAGAVRVIDNKLRISFANTNGIAPDNLTVAVELITY